MRIEIEVSPNVAFEVERHLRDLSEQVSSAQCDCSTCGFAVSTAMAIDRIADAIKERLHDQTGHS